MVSVGVHKLVNAIKVGYLARKVTVLVPSTELNKRILAILRDLFIVNGFIIDATLRTQKVIVVLLKYSSGRPVINHLRIVGKHVGFNSLCYESKYRHALIMSTNRGIITRAEALALGIGGIVLVELS